MSAARAVDGDEGDGEDAVSGAAAAEGTAAHLLCELTIDAGQVPPQRMVLNGLQVTDEMREGAQLWLDTVKSTVAELVGEGYTVTTRTEVFGVTAIDPEYGGTTDCLITATHPERNDVVCVLDYTFGRNIVDVRGNKQLMSYLLCHIDKPLDQLDMRGVIVQPRPWHPDGKVRRATFSADEMSVFTDMVRAAIYLFRSGDAEETVGTHCTYCPRMLHCSAICKFAEGIHEMGDSVVDSPEMAARILEMRGVLKRLIALTEEHVSCKLQSGEEVPGLKLVETYGRRTWSVGEEVLLSKIRNMRVGGKKQLYKQTLRSPAEVEKILGKDVVKKFTKVESSGTTVVPLSDRRPGCDPASIAREFGA